MKIGILTHYYNSVNYGGNLQAYALCKVLEDMGHQPQQVQIDMAQGSCSLLTPPTPLWKRSVKKLVKGPAKIAARLLLPSYRKKLQRKKAARQQLEKAFSRFNRQLIPHGEAVYTSKSIRQALPLYDAFITGSDQIWNPIWYFPAFFLDFVPSDVPKLAYSASIGQMKLPESVKACYRNHLKDFIGVSVREEDAVGLLDGVAPGAVEWVLDPTMLLSREQWLEVAEPAQVKTPYVFCYFLGNDLISRQLAAEYAKKKGLTLVTIPNATGLQHSNDEGFGDIRLDDPSPEAFLGLLHKADHVFTDSFHATVFSLIFRRQFITFPRQGHAQMNSRVISLTELFGARDRFIDNQEKMTLEHLEALPELRYNETPEKFSQAEQRSRDYLENTLEIAKGMLP